MKKTKNFFQRFNFLPFFHVHTFSLHNCFTFVCISGKNGGPDRSWTQLLMSVGKAVISNCFLVRILALKVYCCYFIEVFPQNFNGYFCHFVAGGDCYRWRGVPDWAACLTRQPDKDRGQWKNRGAPSCGLQKVIPSPSVQGPVLWGHRSEETFKV